MLTDAGVDLTGFEVWVWPLTGSDEVLLILNVDDTATGLREDPAASDKLAHRTGRQPEHSSNDLPS